ncbi:hypothetical protein bcere0009_10220 [Bacillus cereus R309803]|nr:hypothetical protein bcere0009_10220 [Bacillus cereus R309803]
MIIRQLTFLYNKFAYVFSNLLSEKENRNIHYIIQNGSVNEIIMCNEKKPQ